MEDQDSTSMKTKEIIRGWLYRIKRRILISLIIVTILGIAASGLLLKNIFLRDSKDKTQELSLSIMANIKGLMMVQNADIIQKAIEEITKGETSIQKAFIIDKDARIAYSSNPSERGILLKRENEESCRTCHGKTDEAPTEKNVITENGNTHRNIAVIYNEPQCWGCHPNKQKINGKIIIDRSLHDTYARVAWAQFYMVGTGLFFLIFMGFNLSKGLNKYILEIMRQNRELDLLYTLVGRLSKTIDMEELGQIVIEILRDALGAENITILTRALSNDLYAASWSDHKKELTFSRLDNDHQLTPAMFDWEHERLTQKVVADDSMEVIVPISKNGIQLALIILKQNKKPFDQEKLDLIEAISGHMAVAFDNARLYMIAITDELTGLYTARHFRYCLDKKLAETDKNGNKLTLLILDIDDFKEINDTHGHNAGNCVLKELAEKIRGSISSEDMVFRYSGEEFCVILPSTTMEYGKMVAERIRKDIAEGTIKIGKIEFNPTVSIGAASCPLSARNSKDLILLAENALYEAKNAGKNRVFISNVRSIK